MSDATNEKNKTFKDLWESSITRRDLLKGAGAAGAAVAFGPVFAACGAGEGASTASPTASASSSPKPGGNLRVGLTGGSSKDVVDMTQAWSFPDLVRGSQLYDTLMTYDPNFRVTTGLAEAVTSDAAAQVWTIRLKPDLTFHNSKAVTADDVIFTLRRILDPKYVNTSANIIEDIDPKRLRKLDERTIEVTLKRPNSILDEVLASPRVPIVPVGYDPKTPVGTGPFMFKTFVPGDRSVFVANKSYWGEGPYVDQVETIDFSDDTAKVNALLGGVVDAIGEMPAAQSASAKSSGFATIVSPTGDWTFLYMRTDLKPFSDVRVRQALRLIVDRPQMVEVALSGYGRVANDVWSPWDPAYPKDLPQRVQDLEQAKSLLKQAGYEDLNTTLLAAQTGPGAVESAQVFGEQASAAGVKVVVKKMDMGEYYGDNYLTYPFGCDTWSTRNYLMQVKASLQWNEPHWSDPEWMKLIAEAWKTPDAAKRNEILHECYVIDYETGGHIIWGFNNIIDARTNKVAGFLPDKRGQLNGNGHLNTVWFV